ncbi:La-related protein 6 [Hordeum vulgare]|nr:La-related protein 6 [Hordeum vulgare]
MYPGDPDERSAKKRFIMATPADVGKLTTVRPDMSFPEQHLTAEVGEDVDYVAMPKASRQRAGVLLYLLKDGYEIKLVESDGLTRAISQVKWSIPNPLVQLPLISSKAMSLISSATQSRIHDPCEPILSFLKDTLCGGGLGSSIAKSDLINHDHKESIHKASSKVKQRICDIREHTMGVCSSN